MIFEVGKTNFKLGFSFVALVVLMLILCDEKIIFLSLCSSLIHESGHLFFIYAVGDKPQNVELTLFGMRIDRSQQYKLSYGKEALISLGGIIFNLIFALICYIIYAMYDNEVFFMLLSVNLVIIFINSLPVKVLDSARALKCILLIYFVEEKCERISDILSYLFVIIFTASVLFYTVFFDVNISLIAVTLYLFTITIIKKWS